MENGRSSRVGDPERNTRGNMAEAQSNPGTEVAGIHPLTAAVSPGMDTAFFMSRGRHLMHAPVQELLAICERLVLQARVLGRENMIPDFEKIAEAARHLLVHLSDTEQFSQSNFKWNAFMTSLTPGDATRGLTDPWTPAVQATPARRRPCVLVVEDDERNSAVVSLLLEQQGYVITVAADGEQAMNKVRSQAFDLVLLDILLPELNGYQVLEAIKTDPALKYLPVIMLSGVGEMDSVVRTIEMGADDYLPKPFNPVLLRARIEASLEKKRLRDVQEEHLLQLQAEREKSEILLRNILPEAIAERLKQGQNTLVDSFPDVTVLFADLVGFIKLSTRLTPTELVQSLNEIFTAFDQLTEKHGLEKIKTIGDAYMAVGGLPNERPDHAEAVAAMALDMQEEIKRFNAAHHSDLSIRIGMHTGPVIAGIIGRNKFTYDLWGDTVNVASRMESQGQPGNIQLTIVTYDRLRDRFDMARRGVIDVKGKGEMTTYILRGRKASQAAAA